MSEDTPKRGPGRPPKRQEKRPVGRPKGEASIMKEYRERMLNSPRSKKVLDAIFKAALDDDHKNQAAAWKIIVDRIVPVSGFDKAAGAVQRSAIQVNITSTGGPVEVTGTNVEAEEPLEGVYSVTEEEPNGASNENPDEPTQEQN